MTTARNIAFDHGAAIRTPVGWITARPGDWIILTVGGAFHVTAGIAG